MTKIAEYLALGKPVVAYDLLETTNARPATRRCWSGAATPMPSRAPSRCLPGTPSYVRNWRSVRVRAPPTSPGSTPSASSCGPTGLCADVAGALGWPRVGRGSTPHRPFAWSARRTATVVAVVAGLSAALVAILAQGQTRAEPVRAARAAAAEVSLLGQSSVMHVAQRTGAGRLSAFRFVASASGMARTAHVYLARASRARAVIVALYANRSGRPGRLLASARITHPRAGWRRVVLRGQAIRKGAAYWLGLLGSRGALVDRVRRGPRCHSLTSAQKGLRRAPRTWRGGSTRQGCSVSALITGTRASTPVPTGGTALQRAPAPAPAQAQARARRRRSRPTAAFPAPARAACPTRARTTWVRRRPARAYPHQGP